MKRLIMVLMALLMAASLFACAIAEDTSVVESVELSDVPNSHTADAVLSLSSVFQDITGNAYDIQQAPVDQLTVDTLLDIFAFVVDAGHRPARYFPEETQAQIAEAIHGENLDTLNMTEFMRLSLAQARITSDVKFQMTLDVDYMPGQTVVVVLADTSDPANLTWTALEAEVVSPGTIETILPQELLTSLRGGDILYSLLTPRRGMTRYYMLDKEVIVPDPRPSIEAGDTSYVERTVISENVEIADDFALVIVEETEEQLNELALLRDYVRNQNRPLIDWFPKEDQHELQLLLGEDVNLDDLVVYDALAMQSVNYQETYGDVLAAMRFVTPYEKGQSIVAVLGIPHEDVVTHTTTMDWAIQIVRVQEGGRVEIAFDQLMMIKMGEQPALLLLLAEPLTP